MISREKKNKKNTKIRIIIITRKNEILLETKDRKRSRQVIYHTWFVKSSCCLEEKSTVEDAPNGKNDWSLDWVSILSATAFARR